MAWIVVVAARIAGARAGPCTAAIIGALLTCLHSGGRFGSVCACAGSTAATPPVRAEPLPNACRNWWRPSPGARAGWPRRRAGRALRWAAKRARGCCPGCPCRPAPTPCRACSTGCLCRTRPRVIGVDDWAEPVKVPLAKRVECRRRGSAADAATARSSSTWSGAAWSVSCPTALRRRWPAGCGSGQGSRWSHATARRSVPAPSATVATPCRPDAPGRSRAVPRTNRVARTAASVALPCMARCSAGRPQANR